MPADVPGRILTAFLGNASAVLMTVPDDKRRVISSIVLCNTTAGALTVTLNHTDTGSAAAASNQIVSALPIAANETLTIGRGFIFDENDKLHGVCSAATSVTITIYYAERPVYGV